MFKKGWESLQSNITEKSNKVKNTRFKKTTRLKRLREKDEDRVSSHSGHISSTSELSSAYTVKNIQKTAKNKRDRAKELKSDVNKLNFSLIDNINFDEFDHI